LDTINCNDVIDTALGSGNAALAKSFKSDVVFIRAPMRPPVDDAIKDEIEEIQDLRGKRGKKETKLTVLVETAGGFVETVERIVSVFRKHYDVVEYVVPNYAYSAGTILVLSGDEIYMDYYSVLGPIDPQMESDEGMMPGMGYLAKYQELLNTINKVGVDPQAIRGELAFLINKFDPAKLFWIEQATEHSKSLLREWLPKYKFKSWTIRETSGAAVTPADREQRADKIAEVLGDAKKWHSHGRGLTIRELESDDIKLKIENYSDNNDLYRNISHYRGLFVDYMGRRQFRAALHTKRGIRRLG
jgi:Serine dehydrogenase proteinase